MKYFAIIFCLFFPIKHFEIFHILLILILSSLLILEKRIVFTGFLKFFMATIAGLWVFTFFRSLLYTGFGLRDYIEIIRFIPMFLLLISGIKFKLNILFAIFFTYTSLDLMISLSQFFSWGFGDLFTRIYGSEYHVGSSLGLSARALGLSSGPGQHGSIMSLFYVFFLYSFLFSSQRLAIKLLGLFCCLIAILLSQSQTSFIAVIIISFFMIGFAFFRGESEERSKSFVAFCFLAFGGMVFFYVFLDELRYLYTLIELGFERNSFQRRLGKFDIVWSLALSAPGLLLIGYGKDFFGTLSRAMDNEYLYVFFIYGFLIGFAFLIMGMIFLLKVLIFPQKYPKNYLLIAFSFLTGLIIAFPTSFFTEPRIMILLTSFFLIQNSNEIKNISVEKK